MHGLVRRANAFLAEGAADAGGGGRGEERSRGDGHGLRRAAPPPKAQTGSPQRSRRSSTSARRRVGSGTSPGPTRRGLGWRRWGSSSRTRPTARGGGGSAEGRGRRCRRAGTGGRGSRVRAPAPPRLPDPGAELSGAGPARSTSWPGTGGPGLRRGEGAERPLPRRGGRGRDAPAKRRRVVRAARLCAAAHGVVGVARALRRGVASTGRRTARASATSGAPSTPVGEASSARSGARPAGARRGWSGKRDSNPRLRPWQGRTLPLSYSRPAPYQNSQRASPRQLRQPRPPTPPEPRPALIGPVRLPHNQRSQAA